MESLTFQEYIIQELDYYKEYELDIDFDDYTSTSDSDNIEYSIAE
jgi:hypothetical protein